MDEPKETILDPNKPDDAINLIDFLTKDLKLSREHNNAFNIALNTIRTELDKNKNG